MKNMYSVVMKIGPKEAKQFLETSNGNPRFANDERLYDAERVKRYASYMKQGKWQLTSQGISFDEYGVLKDGHHRLAAVIESGCEVELYVTYNVPAGHELFDRGWTREVWQIMRAETDIDPQLATRRGVAVANMHFYFSRGCSEKRVELVTMYEKSDFLASATPNMLEAFKICDMQVQRKRMMLNAACIYSIFCALECGVSVDDAREFSRIVNTGMCDSSDKLAAVVFRNYLLENKEKHTNHFSIMAKKAEMMQTCLCDFVKKVPRQKKYAKTTAIYTTKYLEHLGEGGVR